MAMAGTPKAKNMLQSKRAGSNGLSGNTSPDEAVGEAVGDVRRWRIK
jgi:hypothetical protein